MAEYDVQSMLNNIFDIDDLNTWKPSEKILLVIKEIDTIKNDIKTFLGNSDHDLDAILKESHELTQESKSVVDDMEQCRQEIEQETMAEVLRSIESHDYITKELQSVEFALNIVSDVLQCGKYVKEFEDGRQASSFTRAVEAVYDLLQYIELPAEGFKDLDLYSNTRHTGQLILDNLLHDLYAEWDRLVVTDVKTGNRRTIVNITLNLDDSRIVSDILNALEKSKKLAEKVTAFSQFLMKDVIQPIINNECVVFAETDEFMNVTINHKPDFKPTYDAVIANLRLLFHYLSNKLNFEFRRDMTLMKMIGSQLSVEFRDLLVKDCLIHTIPNNINELQTYGVITSEIENFQHFLAMLKFFPDENFSILEYVNNIDVLFADKSSQYFLESARQIMLKDLSVTMSIGVENIPEDNAGSSSAPDESLAEALKILDKTIPKSLFYFPRCMISRTAQELLDLVYVMMEQAVQCSDVVSKKLYNTTRLVFELYDAVVPYHHEKYLQTIPQYVALFHNNCMYLAHNLQTFGDKWLILMEGRELDYPISFVDLVPRLRELGCRHLAAHMQQQRKQILDNIRSSASFHNKLHLAHNLQTFGDKWLILMEGRELDYPISFVDLVPRLRELGCRHLAAHMQQQRKQILDNIRSSDLNCIVVKDVLGDNAEAAVRQCLRQLHLLKNVWVGILPNNVFTKLMSTLVNMFVEELIHRVCTVEDISMEMASQLTDMYSVVVQKAPQLLQSPSDVETHVASWTKLSLLIFVLGGSLKDIEAHWRDGTGPLSVHFRTEELRSLIKALFQNTQFRANLLAKIK